MLKYRAPKSHKREVHTERISKHDMDRYRADPHLMLYESVFFVKSEKRIVHNAKSGIAELQHPTRFAQTQPFFPNFAQHSLIQYRRKCLREKRPTNIIVVKERGIGLSTIASLMILSEALFSDAATVNNVVAGPDNREVLFNDVIGTPITLLPPNFLPSNNRKFLPNFSNQLIRWDGPPETGAFLWRLISAEMGKLAGLGSRALYNFYTEFGKWSSDREVMQGLSGNVVDSYRAMTFVESTGEGSGNLHYEYSMESWRSQGGHNWWEPGFIEDGNRHFTCFFFGWWQDDSRRIPLVDGVTPSMLYQDMTDYERELYVTKLEPRARMQHGLTGDDIVAYCMEQIHWFRCLNINIYAGDRPIKLGKFNQTPPNSEDTRKSEYPSYIEEAFVDTSSSWAREETIRNLIERREHAFKSGLVEERKGRIDDSGYFIEDNADWWVKLYYPPGKLRDGQRAPFSEIVSIGGDVAHGTHQENEEHAKSALFGMNMFTCEQRSQVNKRVPVPQFSNYLDCLAKFHAAGSDRNFPYLCIENADAGLELVQRLATDYPTKDNPDNLKIYYSQDVTKANMPESKAPGFNPKLTALERLAWQKFGEALEAGQMAIYDLEDAIDQISTLIRKPDGKVEAKKKGKVKSKTKSAGRGGQDDVADAAKLAFWHREALLSFGPLEIQLPDYDPKTGLMLLSADLDALPRTHPLRLWNERKKAWAQQRDPFFNAGQHSPPPHFMRNVVDLVLGNIDQLDERTRREVLTTVGPGW